jgi:hypothetical protein
MLLSYFITKAHGLEQLSHCAPVYQDLENFPTPAVVRYNESKQDKLILSKYNLEVLLVYLFINYRNV